MRTFLRWTGRCLLGLLALLLTAALAGAVYQAVASRSDRGKYPPPGQSFDVDGHGMHLVCKGTGEPAVILDAPMGASHLCWSLVQPEVARFTRVIAYDRAGYGWSEPGPNPRTSSASVEELHALLEKAGVKPPYILVGNSIGGINARLFAFRYPREVAGLVLVDPAHEDQFERLPPSARMDPSFVRMLSIFRFAARLGLLRLLDKPLGEGSSELLPKETRRAARAVGFRNAWIDALYQETIGITASFAQVRAARTAKEEMPLGDIPLIVLTRGEKEEGDPDAENILKAWTELHRELAGESRQGEQIIVPESGHFIQADRPGAVVSAIQKLVESSHGRTGTRVSPGSGKGDPHNPR